MRRCRESTREGDGWKEVGREGGREKKSRKRGIREVVGGREAGTEGRRIEEKKKELRKYHTGKKKPVKEQDKNYQACPGSLPWCVLDQPWASASACTGPGAVAQGPGQHGRLLLCLSSFS